MMNHFRSSLRSRSLCQVIRRQISYEAVQNLKNQQKSALFVTSNVSPMFPYLVRPDFSYLSDLFENLESLSRNIAARGLEIDAQKLRAEYFEFKKLEDEMKKLLLEKEGLTQKVTGCVNRLGLSKKDMINNDEVRQLLAQGKTIKTKLDPIKAQFAPMQEGVCLNVMRLPNKLHPSVPSRSNVLLFEHQTKTPNSSGVSFKSAANWSFQQLSDDPFMRYQCGDYAKLEFSINEFFSRELRKHQSFEYIKSCSLLKSALVEGCGEDFKNAQRLLSVLRWSEEKQSKSALEIELLHFTGTSSLYSLMLSYVRTKLNEASLPHVVYTNGKNNSPTRGQVSQFDLLAICSQTAANAYDNTIETQIKAALSNKETVITTKDSQAVFAQLVSLVSSLYQRLNIQHQVIAQSVHSLKPSDCYKVNFDVFVPSEMTYKTVAEVTLLDDYISRRLQVMTTGKSYPSMVHVKLADVNMLTQVILDSSKQQLAFGVLTLPHPLKQMYEELFS